jgi:hypothetical protein
MLSDGIMRQPSICRGVQIVLCDNARVKFTDESAILFWSASNQDGVVGKFRPQRTINFGTFHAIKCLQIHIFASK